MRTWIELGSSLDVPAWTRRHADGLVPDATPYGLGRLADHGHPPRFRGRPGPLAGTVARPVRKVTGLQWAEAILDCVPKEAELALCWDERTGVPRAALSGKDLPVATGVIWLDGPGSYRWTAAAVRALRRCALVWTLSRAQLPLLVELGVPASKVEHLVFGIDADFFPARDVAEVDSELIVSVGNDRHRDWDTLLRAFGRLRRRRPAARLEVVTAAQLPAADGMTVRPRLGHDELRALYARSAVVALPTRPNSHVSGMTAALEAQATGRPVVLSDTPGARDYVTDGRSGHLVPTGGAAELAERLEEVLDGGAPLVAQMGAAGRRAVDTVHNSAHQAVRLAGLIDRHC